jgi:probable rRNA maturation factor
MEIDFENTQGKEFDHCEEMYSLLSDIVQKELKLKPHYFLEVDLVDNKTIHEINADYRKVDRPTDVISFAFLDKVAGETPIKNPKIVFLGQIIISVDKAKEQAHDYSHSLERELAFLFVHGLLHLLGYDHMNKEDEEKMFTIQNKILEESPWKKNN